MKDKLQLEDQYIMSKYKPDILLMESLSSKEKTAIGISPKLSDSESKDFINDTRVATYIFETAYKNKLIDKNYFDDHKAICENLYLLLSYENANKHEVVVLLVRSYHNFIIQFIQIFCSIVMEYSGKEELVNMEMIIKEIGSTKLSDYNSKIKPKVNKTLDDLKLFKNVLDNIMSNKIVDSTQLKEELVSLTTVSIVSVIAIMSFKLLRWYFVKVYKSDLYNKIFKDDKKEIKQSTSWWKNFTDKFRKVNDINLNKAEVESRNIVSKINRIKPSRDDLL